MEAFIATGLAGLVLVWLRFHRRWTAVDKWHEDFSGVESTLAILALVGAAAWYFVARPDAPKVTVNQQVVGYRLSPTRVLVVAEVSISNVGARSLALRGERYHYFIQKLTPLPNIIEREVGALNDDKTLLVAPGDKWAHFARAEGVANSDIEAGEVENLYFRVVLPCEQNLRVYSTIWLDRPTSWTSRILYKMRWRKIDPEGELQWIKQVPLDLSEQCKSQRRRN